MLGFDERSLSDRLGKLPTLRRVMFAAACAERLQGFYDLYCARTGRGQPRSVREGLDAVWQYAEEASVEMEELARLAENCEALVAEVYEPYHSTSDYAENALAAVVYALETPLTHSVERAMWAAMQGHEAADSFVQWRDDVDFNVPGTEDTVLRSREVQAELAQQEADLSELERETGLSDAELAQRLRTRARENPPSYLEHLRGLA